MLSLRQVLLAWRAKNAPPLQPKLFLSDPAKNVPFCHPDGRGGGYYWQYIFIYRVIVWYAWLRGAKNVFLATAVSTQLIALSIMKVFNVYFIYLSRNINEVKRDNMHYLKENNCSTFVCRESLLENQCCESGMIYAGSGSSFEKSQQFNS